MLQNISRPHGTPLCKKDTIINHIIKGEISSCAKSGMRLSVPVFVPCYIRAQTSVFLEVSCVLACESEGIIGHKGVCLCGGIGFFEHQTSP